LISGEEDEEEEREAEREEEAEEEEEVDGGVGMWHKGMSKWLVRA